MTDEEIIKALDCCSGEIKFCSICPYYLKEKANGYCKEDLHKDAYKLIKRKETKSCKDRNVVLGVFSDYKYQEAKVKIVKDFAERLKQEIPQGTHMVGIFDDIDNLVKEMVGKPSKIEHDSLCETETYKGVAKE